MSKNVPNVSKSTMTRFAAMILLITMVAFSARVFAQNSAYVRQADLEDARAKDFRRHEIAAENYERERESHVDQYKEKVERQEKQEETQREAYIVERNHREKGMTDEQLDEILHKKLEREAAQHEAERQSFIELRDQTEAAHHHSPLNENEEYGL